MTAAATSIDTHVASYLDRALQVGAEHYRREVMLPRLVKMPKRIYLRDDDETAYIVEALSAALEGEVSRGRSGHWTYSQSRQIGLQQALRAETERLTRELAFMDETAAEGEV